jgi:hypothetical protein
VNVSTPLRHSSKSGNDVFAARLEKDVMSYQSDSDEPAFLVATSIEFTAIVSTHQAVVPNETSHSKSVSWSFFQESHHLRFLVSHEWRSFQNFVLGFARGGRPTYSQVCANPRHPFCFPSIAAVELDLRHTL